MLGLWSMGISYAYNRHLTERTFWILIGLFLSLEIFAGDYQTLQNLAAERKESNPLESLALRPRRGLQPVSARSTRTGRRSTSRGAETERGRPRLPTSAPPEPTS